jgi:hypothetical protein
MSETAFEIDIDRERIQLDGEWLTAEDLRARIKQKIDAGDYKVSGLSTALERLEESVANLQTITLKVTPEVLATYERIAERDDVPPSMVLRRALVAFLGSEEATQKLYEANLPDSEGDG